MPKIRCFYDDCIFLSRGICDAPAIELDPEDGCLTYSDDPDDLEEDTLLLEEDEIEEFEDEWEDEGFEEIDFDEEEF